MNRLQEIEKRLAELKDLVEKETDTEKLAEYEKEVRSLIQEKGEILGEQRAEARASARAAFENPVNTVVQKPTETDAEKRAKDFISTGRMMISAEEARSVLVYSGNLATPTTVSAAIKDQMNKVPAILDAVLVENHKGEGEHQVAYVKTESDRKSVV